MYFPDCPGHSNKRGINTKIDHALILLLSLLMTAPGASKDALEPLDSSE